MSFDRFYLRKSLYLIGQNMGKTDVGNLKFLCDYDLPKSHLEKIQTAFELFCALEEANEIDERNQTKLIDLLQTLNKGHLLEKYPLHAQEDPVETDRGGQLPTDQEKKEMLKFLLRISNDMSNRDLRNLICFVYDLIPDNWTLINMDSIPDGLSIFRALITARLIGPKNMKILEEIFEVIGRNDLCQMIRERSMITRPVTNTTPVSPPYHTNSMSSYSSSMYTSGNYTTSSSDEGGASMNSNSLYYGEQMSLDHGGTKVQPSAPSTLQSSQVHSPQSSQVHVHSPQQPMTTSVGHGALIYHGGAHHYQPYNNPSSPNPPPPHAPSSLPLGNGHIVPSSNVSSSYSMGSSNPYQITPQPETFGQSVNPSPGQQPAQYSSMPETVSHGSSAHSSHLVPTVSPAQPPMVNIEDGVSMPILVSQSEQGLLRQLEEKEQQLRESDKMKADLLATMEFQRELMNKLMQQENRQAPPQAPPQPLPHQPNQYLMKCKPHGLAIIIGNERFTHNKDRPKLDLNNRKGCDMDMMNFENLFGLLQYECHVHRNETAESIDSLFEYVAKTDHSSYDSFVMCITTHGESNSFIFGSDSVSLDLYTLIKRIQTCPSLFNKPKLFFIQACRMPREDVVSADSGGRVAFTRNVEADVYIAWATSRDQAAYRSQQDGSWFVCALNHVFVQYAQAQDLVSMMYEVTRVVTAAEGRESGTNDIVQQCVETNSQLRGPVRFL